MRPHVLAALLVLFISFAASAQVTSRPNILLLIGDNWSYGHAGCLGDAAAKTPVFDRIAREGTLFRHSFCPVPSCSPTRSSLLTGRTAHQLEDAASLWSKWPTKFRVFPDMLRESGYEVGYTGKGWAPGKHEEYGRVENPAGPEFKTLDAFMTARDKAKPFFFWLGNVDTALHRWREQAENPAGLDLSSVKVPPELPDTPETRASIAAYHEGIKRMDAAMGEAVRRLENEGLLDSTVVFYTSDNGWQFPRGLANCHDTGTRVPLAVRWPGQVPAGRVAEEFVSLTDLAPTFLELAGVRSPAEMTAQSFLDVMMGKPSASSRDHVFVERERHANVRAGDLSYPIRGIRTKDHLLLLNMRPDRWPAGDPTMHVAVGDYGDVDESPAKQVILQRKNEPQMKRFHDLNFGKRQAVELYDLRKDPAQLTNVAGEAGHAGVQEELTRRVRNWMKLTNDPRVDENYDGWDKMPYLGGRPKGKSKK